MRDEESQEYYKRKGMLRRMGDEVVHREGGRRREKG